MRNQFAINRINNVSFLQYIFCDSTGQYLGNHQQTGVGRVKGADFLLLGLWQTKALQRSERAVGKQCLETAAINFFTILQLFKRVLYPV